MNTMERKKANPKPSVLFFGKYNCKYSQQVLENLRRLEFDVQSILSKNRNEKFPEDLGGWQGDYIICFRSYFIIPKSLLDSAKVAAINFHPGSVEYPGSGCLNWALYDNAKIYGVTAHMMNEKIDNGVIIDDSVIIKCAENAIKINVLQRPGKKIMTTKDVLNGWNIPKGLKVQNII